MKKSTIVVTAVLVMALAGGAFLTNPESLQGRFSNITRSPGAFSAPSSSTSSSSLSYADATQLLDNIERHESAFETSEDQFADALADLSSASSNVIGSSPSELEAIFSSMKSAYSSASAAKNQVVQTVEDMDDGITSSSGAHVQSLLTQAEAIEENLVDDFEDIEEDFEGKEEEVTSMILSFGDLEITDFSAFVGSTELVMNINVENHPNPKNASGTESTPVGTIQYNGYLSSSSGRALEFSDEVDVSNILGAGDEELLTLYLDDDTVNSWAVNEVLAGNTLTIDQIDLIVDFDDNYGEFDEGNNLKTYTSVEL